MNSPTKSRQRLTADHRQMARLEALKLEGRHLDPPKGMMLDDPEVVEQLTRLAERLGLSKTATPRQALENYARDA